MTFMDAANSELTLSNNIRGRLVESQEMNSYNNNKAKRDPIRLNGKKELKAKTLFKQVQQLIIANSRT